MHCTSTAVVHLLWVWLSGWQHVALWFVCHLQPICVIFSEWLNHKESKAKTPVISLCSYWRRVVGVTLYKIDFLLRYSIEFCVCIWRRIKDSSMPLEENFERLIVSLFSCNKEDNTFQWLFHFAFISAPDSSENLLFLQWRNSPRNSRSPNPSSN